MVGVGTSRRRVRTRKVAGTAILVGLSYFLLRHATTANRVQRDEVYVIDDVLHLLAAGSLPEPAAYAAGNGYALLTGIHLTVAGGTYGSLELLSPVLGALVVGCLTLIAIGIVRQFDPDLQTVAAAAFPATVFIFAGFTIRIAESSHKKYTFLLVFLALLLVARRYTDPATDRRWRLLFVAVVASIAVFNYIWGIVYGLAAILALTRAGIPQFRSVVGGSVPMVVAFVLPVHLPTASPNVRYVHILVRSLQGQDPRPGLAVGEVGISAWPAVAVGGVSVSSWFVFTAGVFVVAGVAGLGGIHAVARWRRDDPPFARFYTIVGLWFAALGGGLLVAGDIPTFKRVIVIPGTIGVLYAGHVVGGSPRLSDDRRRQVLALLVVVLLCGSVLAIPRAVLDGEPAPYDYYADDDEEAKFEWWERYGPQPTCLQSHQFIDISLSYIVWGLDRPGGVRPVPSTPTGTVVYRSGPEAFLSCAD